MSIAYEDRVSYALARILERLGFKEVAQRKKAGKRVDIMLFYKGLRIAFEGSYDKLDAEKDAEQRLHDGLSDISVAIWYDDKVFPQKLTEGEIEQRLEKANLRVKILAPGEDVTATLMPFVVSKLPVKSLVEGWLLIDLPLLKQTMDYAVQYASSEEKIQALQTDVENFVNEFADILDSADQNNQICKELYDVFYKLYGLSVGDYKEIKELIYRKTALALLLSSVFYESTASKHGLDPVRKLISTEGGARAALAEAFERILVINYQPVFRVAKEALMKLPPEMETALRNLIGLVFKIADNRALLRRDFAGKVYHAIVGDLVVRKGFATYFTSVPAAYLISHLALLTPNDLWKEIKWEKIDSVRGFRICDFAEGTGTLLSAACDAIQYLHIKEALVKGEDVKVDELHKSLMEHIVWGYDALRFAVHTAATTLALRDPGVTLEKMNLYAIPLGKYTSNNGQSRISLGSLEFLGHTTPTTILGYLEGRKDEIATGISTTEEKVEARPVPSSFNVVLMNPPFTRATGRGASVEEGRQGLFGFMTDPQIRKDFLQKYVSVRDDIRKKLLSLANHSKSISVLRTVLSKRELTPFFSIGQAGEGLLFLYLAHEYVKEGDRIAFVLPKNILSGVSWFLARSLLTSMYHLEYIVVSMDPTSGYNFSESTSLSETLLIAKRALNHSEKQRTCIVCLLKKPATAMEATQLAHEIVQSYASKADKMDVFKHGYGQHNIIAPGVVAYTVSRKFLLENIDNWGKLISFTDPWLTTQAMELLEGQIQVGDKKVSVPSKQIGKIARIGIDRHQFHDNFQRVDEGTPGTKPCVFGGGEEIRSKIFSEPNTRILPKTEKGKTLFEKYSSTLLVPDRIWFDTAHVTSIVVSEPVLSNLFYSVRLKKMSDIKAKALCLWLNTTWGLLTILASREETRGRWISLKMGHWKLLPVLDVASLPKEKLSRLGEIFKEFAETEWRRLPEQFTGTTIQEDRVKLDLEVLKILQPNVNLSEAEGFLRRELYVRIGEAFKSWIG
ncbi:MAG: hypothetical protein ACPLZY_00405 [Candidatus Norongarragalinales archaeon]